MAKDIFDIVAEKPVEALSEIKVTQPEDIFDKVAAPDRSIVGSFRRGTRAGVSGLLTGSVPEAPPPDETWTEFLSSLAGEVISDIPAFWVGGEIGALGGAAAGSIIPGAGTAAGGLLGGAAGAMSAPTMIKTSFREYRDFVESGGDISFGDFLERAGRVGKETGKSALVGIAMAGMSKALPILKKIPKFNKFLNTKPGKIAAEAGLEFTGLTGAQAALEGELPTAKGLVGSAAVLGGFKATRAITGKAKQFFKKPLVEPKVKSPKVQSAFEKTVKDILPVEWEKRAESKAKKARYEDVLKDYLGSKNAKQVESTFEWQERQAQYEKLGGKFTPKQLEDMLYYSQKTGNPEFGFEDSFTDVSNRLPDHAKNFITEVLRPHLKKSLQDWNNNPITKNINPRKGLEEYYLPGMYEKASNAKVKAAEHKMLTKFKVKNPFSNAKSFMTYNEAALEAGLKPRFKNPIELMKQYDKVNIKLMHNAELLDMITKFQTHNNEKIIVNSNRPREYAKAAAEGYKEFEDPFLRSFKDKGGNYQTSSKPALVDPEFAKAFSGVFSKDAFRTDSKFWKTADSVKNQINFMRVAASPFHYIAETESILGQRGLKGLRFKSMANKGRDLRQNKEFMVDAARHGLKLSNRLGVESLKKGNNFLEKGLDLVIESENKNIPRLAKKGLAIVKKGMTYLFDEFIPNAKAVSYEEAVKNQTAKFTKKHGRAQTPQEAKAMKRIIAEHMNNIYGGQNWEQSKYFRDPRMRKALRRTFAFPDWTVSALKQALSVGKRGLAGDLSRNYMAKYLLYTGGIAALLRSLMGGLEQTDEENKSIEGIRWNPKKGAAALADVKNAKGYFSFTLPDLPIRYGKKEDQVLNMGRDDRGVRMQGHFGKQLLEIKGWSDFPQGTISTAFNKSTPLFTIPFKQAFGITPTPKGIFQVDRGFQKGRPAPWQGKKGFAQLKRRALVLAEEFVPFGMRGGAKKWIASIGGAFPIGKEYTLFKAEDDIESALLLKDKKARDEKMWGIKSLLKSNNFTDKQIESRIRVVRSQLVKDKDLPPEETLKGAEPKIKELLVKKDIKGLNQLKKDLMENGYTSRGINSRISKIRKTL